MQEADELMELAAKKGLRMGGSAGYLYGCRNSDGPEGD